MDKERKADQQIASFSAPKSLIALADAEARKRKMNRTGFFRFCLAKELGYSDDAAKEMSMHMSVQNFRAQIPTPSGYPLSDADVDQAGAAAESHKKM